MVGFSMGLPGLPDDLMKEHEAFLEWFKEQLIPLLKVEAGRLLEMVEEYGGLDNIPESEMEKEGLLFLSAINKHIGPGVIFGALEEGLGEGTTPE